GRQVRGVGEAVEDARPRADVPPGSDVGGAAEHDDAELAALHRPGDHLAAPHRARFETDVGPTGRLWRHLEPVGAANDQPAQMSQRRFFAARSCSSRAFPTSSERLTSATGTSHQLSYPGTPS